MKAIIAGLLMCVATSAMAQDKAPLPEPATHPDWSEVRAEAEDYLKRDLIDPESARFVWTRGFEWTSYKNSVAGIFAKKRWGWLACGTINAKNRMGGYSGPERVVVAVQADGTRLSGMAYKVDSFCSYDSDRYGKVVPELKQTGKE